MNNDNNIIANLFGESSKILGDTLSKYLGDKIAKHNSKNIGIIFNDLDKTGCSSFKIDIDDLDQLNLFKMWCEGVKNISLNDKRIELWKKLLLDIPSKNNNLIHLMERLKTLNSVEAETLLSFTNKTPKDSYEYDIYRSLENKGFLVTSHNHLRKQFVRFFIAFSISLLFGVNFSQSSITSSITSTQISTTFFTGIVITYFVIWIFKKIKNRELLSWNLSWTSLKLIENKTTKE